MKKLLLTLMLLATVTARAELTWLTDLDEAKKVATKENKKLLVDFTGSARFGQRFDRLWHADAHFDVPSLLLNATGTQHLPVRTHSPVALPRSGGDCDGKGVLERSQFSCLTGASVLFMFFSAYTASAARDLTIE